MHGKTALIQKYYDRYADVYDTKHGVALAGHVHNFSRYYEPFLLETISPGSRVLELGCGSGFYTRWLVDHGCQVTAMDISHNIIACARRRCPDATYVEGDCENPKLYLDQADAPSQFDFILGVNTFSYYPNKIEALRCYKQLLSPQGKLVLLDMNGQSPLYRMMRITGKNEMREWFSEVSQSTRASLSKLIENAGMRLCKFGHFAFIPNGVRQPVVSMLRPFDALLHQLPGLRDYSMRIILVAEANE